MESANAEAELAPSGEDTGEEALQSIVGTDTETLPPVVYTDAVTREPHAQKPTYDHRNIQREPIQPMPEQKKLASTTTPWHDQTMK